MLGLGFGLTLRGVAAATASPLFKNNYATGGFSGTFARASAGFVWSDANAVVTKSTNVARQNASGLLMEKSVANAAPVLSGATMFSSAVSATKAAGMTSPDGSSLCCAVTATSNGGRGERQITVANDGNTHWCCLVMEKKSVSETATLQLVLTGGSTVTVTVGVNIQTGTTGSPVAVVIDRGSWWEVWAPITNNSTGNTTLTIRGTVQLSGNTVNFWGMQCHKAQDFYTSLVDASATRAAESLTTALSSISGLDSQDATWVVEWATCKKPASGNRHYLLHIDDGSENNVISIFLDANGYVNAEIVVGGVQQEIITGALDYSLGGRAAFAVTDGDCELSVNGTSVDTGAPASLPSGLTTWRHGHDSTPANHANGYLVNDAVYRGRLAA